MSRGMQIIWAIVVVIILVGGYWWWTSMQSNSASQGAASATTTTTTTTNASTSSEEASTGASATVTATVGSSAPTTATVTFNGSSFSPSNVTIAQGGTVRFVSTGGAMWIASDPHPIHNGYDGTTQQQHCAASYAGPAPFDECSSGTSFSFSFNKVGAWGYHDHFDASAGGTVTVVAQ